MIQGGKKLKEGEYNEDISWRRKIQAVQIMKLDDDLTRAMEKMERIEKLYSGMPKLDCGSCGSPSCRALAEDIVRGYAKETDCIFKLREKVNSLAREMLELEGLTVKNVEGNEEK